MKTSALVRNGVSTEMVHLIGCLVGSIAWPARRAAMGNVTLSLLEGKIRAAEAVFGWNRGAIVMGIHEHQTGITCLNDISSRLKPKTEDKHPQLLAEIHAIMVRHSQSESSLRTTLLDSQMTANTVHAALLEKGWATQSLPSVRTISNLLNRQDYRLRTDAKTRVQKKQPKPSARKRDASTRRQTQARTA